jgi:hypothetical protein
MHQLTHPMVITTTISSIIGHLNWHSGTFSNCFVKIDISTTKNIENETSESFYLTFFHSGVELVTSKKLSIDC